MYRIKKLILFESPTYFDWVIYFTAFILLQIPAIINFYYNDGNHNSYLHFAQSLLDGNLHLPPSTDHGDLAFFNGKLYLPYPPLPAILLVPFVFLFGAANVNTVAIATGISCLCLYLIYNILSRLKIDKEYTPWLIAAILFGTGFWYALFTSHHVYAFAHIISFLFQLLILNEIFGRRRWWLIGLYIGCCFLTRQFTLFYAFFVLGYMLYLHTAGKEKIRLRTLIGLTACISLFVIPSLAYNYLRFGNAFDSGYKHIVFIGVLNERVAEYGIFNLRYVPYNLYCTLIKGFNIEFEGKTHLQIRDMDLWGTSLMSASPFLIACFRAQWPKILKISAWATILIILIGHSFYHNNGYEQVNTSRFTLDFLPLLLVLVFRGIDRIPTWLIKGMITYAIGLNVLSFVIHLLYQ